MAGKVILISGATGMIGKSIIDFLIAYNCEQAEADKKVRVIALSRHPEQGLRADYAAIGFQGDSGYRKNIGVRLETAGTYAGRTCNNSEKLG